MRERFACRACEAITQPPAPFHPIARGRAGPNLLATVLEAKFGQHLPLNRQSETYAREGVEIGVSTLSDWVGASAAALAPLVALVEARVMAAERLHADDTTVPLLARGKTATARLWTYVRDDRPFAGPAPPAALFRFSRDRAAQHPDRHLAGYSWILQADAYAGFNDLYAPGRGPGPVTEAACWAHARRKLFELAEVARAPLAAEAVRRIDAVFDAERAINGLPAAGRLAARRERVAPLVAGLGDWMRGTRGKLSRHNEVAKALDYALKRWDAFARFLGDGRVCLTNNAAERALRGVALGRRAWLFAGSDRGGERAAAMYSLVVTAKLNGADPRAWLADVLARIADHPASRLHELLPWSWRTPRFNDGAAEGGSASRSPRELGRVMHRTCRRRRVAAAAAAALALALGAHPAPARGAEPASAADLCVVQVEDAAAAGSIEARQPHRYLWGAYTFSGSPLVVLKPLNRPGNWTLSDDRRFVPLAEGAPMPVPAFPTASAQNDFAVEAHSGRVLGITSGRGVWALPPSGGRFAAHRPEQWLELGFLRTGTMAYVPAWRATVIGGVAGLFAARDDDPIAPVPGPDGLPLGDVTRALAVPGRGAAVVGTIYGRLGLVTGEHGPERMRWFSLHPAAAHPGPGYVTHVFPLPRPGAFLVRSQYKGHILWLPPGAEATGEAALEEVERAPPGPPFAGYRQPAPSTGEYLVYVPVAQRERLPAGAGLFRLEGARFVPVPGGDAAALGGNGTRLYAVPSRGLVVASRTDGHLFVYRGGAIAPVQDGDAAGPNQVHDLPVVGRVVVTSLRGAFELTQDLRLVPVAAPVPLSRIAEVVEMPSSGIAAVIGQEGVFALGPEGGLAPVPGGEAAWSRVAPHVFLPSRSELLFAGHEGLFLLIDRRLSGADACSHSPP